MHNDFVQLAINRAIENVKKGGYPFGAVIVKDGKVIGNSNVDDLPFDPTAHAEMSAIRNACKNLKTYDLAGCQIYSSCHPCQMCLGAIKWVGIKEIFYAVDESDVQAIGCADDVFMDNSVTLTKTKVKDERVLDLMKIWYQQIKS